LQFGGWDWISSNANLKTAKKTLKLARLVKDACRRISALTCYAPLTEQDNSQYFWQGGQTAGGAVCSFKRVFCIMVFQKHK